MHSTHVTFAVTWPKGSYKVSCIQVSKAWEELKEKATWSIQPFPRCGLLCTEDHLGVVLAQEDTGHGNFSPRQLQDTLATFYSF